MPPHDDNPEQVQGILDTPALADALESEQFRRFLDQIPIAIVVSEMAAPERIVYANPQCEKVSGQTAAHIVGKPWSVLRGRSESGDRSLGEMIVETADFVGTFRIERDGAEPVCIDAYSNLIEDDSGTPIYRLAALVETASRDDTQRELEQKILDRDILLLEMQHRVKNNLQMITALIRIEARNTRGRIDQGTFDRLAGRVESLQLLYAALSVDSRGDEIDLGIYLSEIASSVMRSHGREGIRLDLKVDAYPVSVNVAMPAGLVVNELLTNALKHAFVGRDGGTIGLHSLSDGNGCRVTITDDGVGLPEGATWPKPGKLSALIVQSLRENAKAALAVESQPGKGMRVIITFTRAAAAPASGG
ncbi:MAG: ATP-binding protein [Proteobacteria bacterium]|nr:ATP-binding protein [Pseudomonadota bacterium]